jgi:hypothetical protein
MRNLVIYTYFTDWQAVVYLDSTIDDTDMKYISPKNYEVSGQYRIWHKEELNLSLLETHVLDSCWTFKFH